jgi:valyl-tRNA synthetase
MKKFANKLWNIARFVITNLENYDLRFKNYELKPQTKADRDILKKLDQTITTVTKNIESFNLHEAAQEIYQFTWHEFADIYIEASKEQLKNEKLKESTHNILFLLLNTVLRLLHPFMPFITEEIWSELGSSRDVKKPKQNDLLMITSWPK